MALEVFPPDHVPSEADIQAVEQRLGFRIPDRYRELLPLLVGTKPEKHVFKLGGVENHSIHQFETLATMVWAKEAVDSRSPSTLRLLPFASDAFGNSFCIVSADCPENGAIYFAEHEIEGDEALERIADDLDALMRSAQPDDFDPGEVPVKGAVVWARPGALEMFKALERQKDERRLREKPNVFPPPDADRA